jgi:hypothetical protein
MVAFTDSDATVPFSPPTSSGVRTYRRHNDYTQFDDLREGHFFTVLLNANTTLQHNSNIKLAGGADHVGSANDTISFITYSSVAFETARSVNGA